MTASVAAVDAFSLAVSGRATWIFAVASDADGLQGFGETVPDGSAAEVEEAIRHAGSRLVGLNAARAADAVEQEAQAANVLAGAALSQALRDLAARSMNLPLAQTVGEPRRYLIKCYANVNRGLTIRTPAVFATRAGSAVEAGFCAIKIAPFDEVTPATCASTATTEAFDRALDRMTAVHEVLGDRAELFVDCHWRLDERGAMRAMDHGSRCGVTWFECPLVESEAMLPALRRLRRHAEDLGIRLVGGDEFRTEAKFARFVGAEVYDVLMPDVAYLGVHRTLRIAQTIEAAGAACSLHNPRGPIAHAHSCHLSVLLAGTTPLEYPFMSAPNFHTLTSDGLIPAGGLVHLSDAPGLGVQLYPERIRARPAKGSLGLT